MRKKHIQKILRLKLSLLLTILLSLTVGVAAQEIEKSAQNEFEDYGRNPKFTTLLPKLPPKQKRKRQSKTKKTIITSSPKPPNKTLVTSDGKPGMKIWAERKIDGEDSFFQVMPTTIFKSEDWVRFSFRLNFEGYLVIFYRGSTGKTQIIFPKDDNYKIVPETTFLIPHDKGWQFDKNVGDEELLFIVSRNLLNKKSVQELSASRDFESEAEVSVRASDRDLIIPKTENDSVYVLSDDARLKKPLVFRMTLKHQ